MSSEVYVVTVQQALDAGYVAATGSATWPPQVVTLAETNGRVVVGSSRDADGRFHRQVGLCRFDTSMLPDSDRARVGWAKLEIYIETVWNMENLTLGIGYYPNNWPIDMADYTVSDETSAAQVSLSSLRGGAYNTIPLGNVQNIARAGYTAFRMTLNPVSRSPAQQNYVVAGLFSQEHPARLTVGMLRRPVMIV